MADAAKPAATPPATENGAYRAYVLGGLFVVYTFNFIDRQIVSVLQEPNPFLSSRYYFVDV